MGNTMTMMRSTKEVNLVNVSNHKLTAEQTVGFTKIVDLPEELKKEWANITPENIEAVIANVHSWIREQGEHFETVIHIAGQMSAVHVLLTLLQASEYTCVYSFTERVSEDIPQEDGSVKKIISFKHKGWVEYINPLNSIKL